MGHIAQLNSSSIHKPTNILIKTKKEKKEMTHLLTKINTFSK